MTWDWLALYLALWLSQEKRTDISREFTSWLKECHNYCDKQVQFCGNEGNLTRPELPRNKQSPWTTFERIEWDSKVYKRGQVVGGR